MYGNLLRVKNQAADYIYVLNGVLPQDQKPMVPVEGYRHSLLSMGTHGITDGT